MRNHMKSPVCLLSVILIFCLFVSPAAAVSDTEPPELLSISVTQNVTIGETVTFSVEGRDNISGFASVMVEYRSENQERCSIYFENPGRTQDFTLTVPLPLEMLPGKWAAVSVTVRDYASNYRTYFCDDDTGPVRFSGLELTVADNPARDCVPPTLVSLRAKKSSIAVPGKIELVAEITDNLPGELTVSFSYMCGSYQNGAMLYRNPSTGQYEGELYVGERFKNLPLTFHGINITDAAGNAVWYIPGDPPAGISGYCRRLEPSCVPEVRITNSVHNETAPTLLDFSFKKTVVYIPGKVDFSLQIEDEDLAALEVDISFATLYPGKEPQLSWLSSAKYQGGSTFTGSIMLDPYTDSCKMQICRIELTDSSGNRRIYTSDGSEGDRLDTKYVWVVDCHKPDLTTGTTAEGYLEKIRATDSNAVILLDCTADSRVPAEVFAAVRGTGRTLILNSEGIEWIFSGMDMTGENKAIDCAVNYEVFYGRMEDGENDALADLLNDKPALLIRFAPNGKLPGRATVRIKAEYTFQHVIGIEDLDVFFYDEKAGKLDPVDSRIALDEQGFYPFTIDHNSRFLITPRSRKTPATPVTKTDEPSALATASDTSSPPSSATETQPVLNVETTNPAGSDISENRNDHMPVGILVSICAGISLILFLTAICLIPKTRNAILKRCRAFAAVFRRPPQK